MSNIYKRSLYSDQVSEYSQDIQRQYTAGFRFKATFLLDGAKRIAEGVVQEVLDDGCCQLQVFFNKDFKDAMRKEKLIQVFEPIASTESFERMRRSLDHYAGPRANSPPGILSKVDAAAW